MPEERHLRLHDLHLGSEQVLLDTIVSIAASCPMPGKKQVLNLQFCPCLAHGCKTRLFATFGDAQASHCVRRAKTQKHLYATNNGIIGAPAPRLFMLVLKSLPVGRFAATRLPQMNVMLVFLVWAVGIESAR